MATTPGLPLWCFENGVHKGNRPIPPKSFKAEVRHLEGARTLAFAAASLCGGVRAGSGYHAGCGCVWGGAWWCGVGWRVFVWCGSALWALVGAVFAQNSRSVAHDRPNKPPRNQVTSHSTSKSDGRMTKSFGVSPHHTRWMCLVT